MVLDRVSELENEEYMSMTQEERDSINEIFEMLKAQQSSDISTDSVDPSTLDLAAKHGDIEREQEAYEEMPMIDVETIARKWANVYELALPADLEGGYDAANNRILISDRLTPIQRRCVLAHEISHARHHDVGCKCDSATERRADMEAARMLVNQLEYQSAEIIFDGDECAIARELNVMPWIIRAYKNWLHDSVTA